MQKIMSQIASELSQELGISLQEEQVLETVRLLDSGHAIPFVARYRKEVTGGLTEDQLRALSRKLSQLRKLEARKWEVVKLISKRNTLPEQLRRAILEAKDLNVVEDLYRPYKPRRRTRASVARGKGLEPLARLALSETTDGGTLDEHAAGYIDPDKGMSNTDDVLAEVRAIVAEIVAEDADVREMVRQHTRENGRIVSQKSAALLAPRKNARPTQTDDPQKSESPPGTNGTPEPEKQAPKRGGSSRDAALLDKYKDFFDYSEQISKITPETALALDRGEKDRALTVKVSAPAEEIVAKIEAKYVRDSRSVFAAVVKEAIADGYERLLAPSIERDVKRDLTKMADEHALDGCARRLRELLLQPPVRNKRVLAIDPAYRTGCGVAVLSDTGEPIAVDTIYPHHPRNAWEESKRKLCSLIQEHEVDIIAIGDGAACRETEALAGEVIAELNGKSEGRDTPADASQDSNEPPAPESPVGRANDLVYTIVNEAGASTYATSRLARQEFPKLDRNARGAISIGRRLQDPLAELVKIDPKLAASDPEHDTNRKELGPTLNAVVESCVNYVGADLNAASPRLLRNIAGLGRVTAEKIVEKRSQIERFTSREQLKEVEGINDQIYTQAAGFLRIADGENPLDNTPIHPENYALCERVLSALNLSLDHLRSEAGLETVRKSIAEASAEEMATQLGASVSTLRDIFENIANPGRDPRDDMPPPTFKRNALTMHDLKPGMKLKGAVRNIVDFGVFVDLGVKRDGLIHVSQLSDDYIESPRDLVSVGDVVEVRVLAIDSENEKIKLTMKSESSQSERDAEGKGDSRAKSSDQDDPTATGRAAPRRSDDRSAKKQDGDSAGERKDDKPRGDRRPQPVPRRKPKDSAKPGRARRKASESRPDKRDESDASGGLKLKDTPEWRSLLQKFGR